MALRALKFVGPTLMPSYLQTAVTVRLGTKWATVKENEYVHVTCCPSFHEGDCGDLCEDYGYAVVQEVWVGQLQALPARMIAEEHEPDCRHYYGLKMILTAIYAPQPVDGHSQIVAISFKRVSDYVEEEDLDGAEEEVESD